MIYIARMSHLLNLKHTNEIQRLMNKRREVPPIVNMYLLPQVYKSCSKCVGKKVDSVGMRKILGVIEMF